jgi:hypothetical protein
MFRVIFQKIFLPLLLYDIYHNYMILNYRSFNNLIQEI